MKMDVSLLTTFLCILQTLIKYGSTNVVSLTWRISYLNYIKTHIYNMFWTGTMISYLNYIKTHIYNMFWTGTIISSSGIAL